MKSMVIDLQKDCMNSSTKVSELLRKAYSLARKLRINDFEKWLNCEMNGYGKDEDLPPYRKAIGTVKGFNPYHGWIPVIIEDEETRESLCTATTIQPVVELENLFEKSTGLVQLPLSDALSKYTGFQTNYRLEIGVSQVKAIIERVRNIILEWLLKLEEDGITAEEMQVSDEERRIVERNTYTVNNFYGDVKGSQIQQNTSDSNQYIIGTIDNEKLDRILEMIEKHINEIGLEEDGIRKVQKEVMDIKEEKSKKSPQKVIILESLKSIRTILEGAVGSIIASGILYQMNLFS